MKNKIIILTASVVILVGLFFIGSKLYKDSETSRIAGLSSENAKLFWIQNVKAVECFILK